MKYKILLFFLMCGCISNSAIYEKTTYTNKGFAYIYSEDDKKKGVVNKNLDNNKNLIGHKKLKLGTMVKIINPDNDKFIKLKVNKKVTYPDFYEILITERVANHLELNKDVPYVEIQELKKNKSFIADRAVTFNQEKKVNIKVPVTIVKIDNISKNKNLKIKKNINFTIIIASFYSRESAIVLKNSLLKEYKDLSSNKISVIKVKKNNFDLRMGPYRSINSLKNEYIILKRHGFEQLDILKNE